MSVHDRSRFPFDRTGVMLLAVALLAGVAGSAATLAITRGFAPTADAAAVAGVVERARDPVPFEPDDAPRVANAAPALGPDLDADRTAAPGTAFDERFEEADAARSQLAATVISLSREVESLSFAIEAMNLPGAGADPEGGAGVAGNGTDDPDGPGRDRPRRGEPSRASRLESLVAAGLDAQAAEELERRGDAWQLERLELVDQASREGWSDSDAFDDRLEALDESAPDLRAELGEEGYDRYLHASGGSNRVGVASIIPGSAAEVAGLRSGDVIYSYASERIFGTPELQGATRAGTRGEYVTVMVERDGRSVGIDVPRGPLGITLVPQRRAP